MRSSCRSDSRCISELEPAAEINKSDMVDDLNESDWSYENYGFFSLPTRGYKKNRRPGIKFMINSETVSQTKTIIYKQNDKPPDPPLPSNTPLEKPAISKSDSLASLNSNYNPEVVAALDQIASEMGLIQHPVMRQSKDPVSYLLATKSFSERSSVNKLVSVNKFDRPRPYSYICYSNSHAEVPATTEQTKDDLSISNSYPAQKPKKKKGTITRIFEKLSPKSIRRSKSIPTTINTPLYAEKTNKSHNHVQNKQQLLVEKPIAPIRKENCSSSNLTNNDNATKTNPQYVNENSKRLMDSLKIDRIEQPQIKFRSISRRRVETNLINLPAETIIIKTPSPDSQVTREVESPRESRIIPKLRRKDKNERSLACNIEWISDKKPELLEPIKINSLDEFPRPKTGNSRYVNVSLCAFGYGPYRCTYRSQMDSRPKSVTTNDHQSLQFD